MKPLKQLKKIVLLFVFIPVICFSQKKEVLIRIIQNESVLLGDFQTNLTLNKRGFKFQVLLENVGGVYVFASIQDSIYRFTETSPIRDFPYLNLLQIKDEDRFNTNKELNIGETGWTYWFYNDSVAWHPFNLKTVGLGKNRVVCTKAIKQVYDVADRKVIKIKNINTPLYLFFIAVKDYDENGKPKSELMRRKVKIEWTNNN